MKDDLCKFGDFDVSDKVFAKSEDAIAIYNLAPIVPGHSMVVPVDQFESLKDLSEEKLCTFFSFSRRVTKFLVKEFQATGFDWSLQDGWSAGQTIPHIHLHIIPRVDGDLSGPGSWYPELIKSQDKNIDSENRYKLKPEEIKRIVTHLRTAWRNKF